MSLFHSVILGIIQGITEFLPISSTGHLILAEHLLRIPQTDFVKSYDIAIQSGTMLAVIVLYWRNLFCDWETIKRIVAAFIPTAIVGAILYKVVKKVLLGNSSVVLWTLLIGGIFLILFEKKYKNIKTEDTPLSQIPYKHAILIGLCQSLAMIPGVSRSAATILGGLMLGLKRRTIVEFSFLLAVPTLFAATALDLVKSGCHFSGPQTIDLLVGTGVSFLVGMIVIKLFLTYIRKHTFTVFGIYRILLACFLFFLIR